MTNDKGDTTTDISKPIEFNSEDVDDGFQHFWLPMIFMAMPGQLITCTCTVQVVTAFKGHLVVATLKLSL